MGSTPAGAAEYNNDMIRFLTQKIRNRDYPSQKYLRLFAIRFVAYFAIFVSTFATIAQFGPIVYAEFNYRRDQIFNVQLRALAARLEALFWRPQPECQPS